MDFEVHRDFERPFIEIRIAGRLTVESSKNRIARLVENEHYREGLNLLFDLRQAELHSFDLNHMRSLEEPASRLSEQDAASLPPSSPMRRVAFLVASESDKTIMKLYNEMLGISATAPEHDRRVFRDREEAVAWIAGTAMPAHVCARGAVADR